MRRFPAIWFGICRPSPPVSASAARFSASGYSSPPQWTGGFPPAWTPGPARRHIGESGFDRRENPPAEWWFCPDRRWDARNTVPALRRWAGRPVRPGNGRKSACSGLQGARPGKAPPPRTGRRWRSPSPNTTLRGCRPAARCRWFPVSRFVS